MLIFKYLSLSFKESICLYFRIQNLHSYNGIFTNISFRNFSVSLSLSMSLSLPSIFLCFSVSVCFSVCLCLNCLFCACVHVCVCVPHFVTKSFLFMFTLTIRVEFVATAHDQKDYM